LGVNSVIKSTLTFHLRDAKAFTSEVQVWVQALQIAQNESQEYFSPSNLAVLILQLLSVMKSTRSV
jgi:hypothetical protein